MTADFAQQPLTDGCALHFDTADNDSATGEYIGRFIMKRPLGTDFDDIRITLCAF
jgi:hypothetical protein